VVGFTPPALCLGHTTSVPCEEEAGWAAEQIMTPWREIFFAGNRMTIPQLSRP